MRTLKKYGILILLVFVLMPISAFFPDGISELVFYAPVVALIVAIAFDVRRLVRPRLSGSLTSKNVVPAENKHWLKSIRKDWNSDMERAGLLVTIPSRKKDVQPRLVVPTMGEISAAHGGITFMMHPVSGYQSVDDLIKNQARLESIWACPIRMEALNPNTVLIRVMFTNPLDGIIHYDKWSESSIQQGACVGRTEEGHDLRIALLESNVLIGGIPGSGKSGAISALLAEIAHMPNTALFGIDPKQVELALWRSRFSEIVTDLDASTELLQKMVDEMETRYKFLADHGMKKFKASDFTPQRPLLVLVIDEMAELVASGVNSAEKKKDDERKSLIRRLVAKGRASGICAILATQKPSADVVPTAIRDLVAQRICFATTTPEMTETILGAGSRNDAPAHQIPASAKGECYVLGESSSVAERAKFTWVPDEICGQIANETKSLRLQVFPTPPAFGENDF